MLVPKFFIALAGRGRSEGLVEPSSSERWRNSRTRGDCSTRDPFLEEFLSSRRFAGILALLLLVAFPSVLFGQQTFIYKDFGLFGYPFAAYHRECFWQGELPLWNPLSACGAPFLAQWNTLTLYPLSLIYLMLPLPWSLNLFCIVHLFLAGMGMYFLGSAWGGSRLGGAVAGAAFTFGGVLLSSLMWPAYLAGLGWMPWVVLMTVRAWREGGRHLLLAALVGAMQMLSGAAELILFTWFFLGCLWLGDILAGDSRRRPVFWRLLVVGVLVAGLAATQLLPFLDLLAHSHRDATFAHDRWAMPAWGWANLLLPLFRYYPSEYGVYLQGEQSMLTSYYPGIVTVALSMLALLLLRDRRLWIGCGVTLLSLVLAWGDNSWLYAAIRESVPQIGFMRFPVKFAMLPAFIFPLMAALLIGALMRLSPAGFVASVRSAVMVWIGIFALLVFLVCVSQGYPIEGESWRQTLPNAAARFGFLTLALAGLLVRRRVTDRPWQRVIQIAIVAVVALDGWTQLPVIQPTTTPEVLRAGFLQLDPKPRLGESRAHVAMSAHREIYRFLPDLAKTFAGYRLGGIDNTPLLDGVSTVDGFYALYLRESRELWSELFFQPRRSDDRLLDFLCVSQVSTSKFDWVHRASALPLVTAGQRPQFLDDTNTLRVLRSAVFNARENVLLPPDARKFIFATNRTDARVATSKFGAHEITLEVDAKSPALVVVSQAFYHPWTVYVAGRQTPLLRANYAFQAFEVPAGHSHVRLVYEDQAFRTGAVISLLALGTCLFGLVRPRRLSRAAPVADDVAAAT